MKKVKRFFAQTKRGLFYFSKFAYFNKTERRFLSIWTNRQGKVGAEGKRGAKKKPSNAFEESRSTAKRQGVGLTSRFGVRSRRGDAFGREGVRREFERFDFREEFGERVGEFRPAGVGHNDLAVAID